MMSTGPLVHIFSSIVVASQIPLLGPSPGQLQKLHLRPAMLSIRLQNNATCNIFSISFDFIPLFLKGNIHQDIH
jgi:hypothetical protein